MLRKYRTWSHWIGKVSLIWNIVAINRRRGTQTSLWVVEILMTVKILTISLFLEWVVIHFIVCWLNCLRVSDRFSCAILIIIITLKIKIDFFKAFIFYYRAWRSFHWRFKMSIVWKAYFILLNLLILSIWAIWSRTQYHLLVIIISNDPCPWLRLVFWKDLAKFFFSLHLRE